MSTPNMADIGGVLCAVEGFERGLDLIQSEVYLWSLCNSLEGVAGVEIALIHLSGLSKHLSGQVDCPTEVIRRTSR